MSQPLLVLSRKVLNKKSRLVACALWLVICAITIAPMAAVTCHVVPSAMFGWSQSSAKHVIYQPATLQEVPVAESRRYPYPSNWHFYDAAKPGMVWLATDDFYETTYTHTGATTYRGFVNSYAHRTFDSCCHDIFILGLAILAWAVVVAFLVYLLPTGRAALKRLAGIENISAVEGDLGTSSRGFSTAFADIAPQISSCSPKQPDKESPDSGHRSNQGRARLMWMNFAGLLFYACCFRGLFLGGKSIIGWFVTLVLASILVSASLLALLAARNPAHETRRKLAKWLNVVVLGFALLGVFIANGSASALIGFITLTVPALINVGAFWKRSATAGPSCSELPSHGPLIGGEMSLTAQPHAKHSMRFTVTPSAKCTEPAANLVKNEVPQSREAPSFETNARQPSEPPSFSVALQESLFEQPLVSPASPVWAAVKNVATNKDSSQAPLEITPVPSAARISQVQPSIIKSTGAGLAEQPFGASGSSSVASQPQQEGLAGGSGLKPSARDGAADGTAAPKSKQKDSASDTLEQNAESRTSVRRSNYFVRHWRGDLSLGVSYWVNGLLATLLLSFVAASARPQDMPDMRLGAAWVLVVYTLAIAVSVWQAIGVWRSASNHVLRGGKQGWATAAQVAVIMAVLRCLILSYRTYIPQSVEMVMIIAGDPQIPAYHVRVLPGGMEVEFRGGMRAGCEKELRQVLSAVPQAKVLHIESTGGRFDEATKMIQLVQNRKLLTYTSEYCKSAATFVLMSGKERVVDARAKVGFHAGTLPGATSEQRREIDNVFRTVMRSAGVSEKFTSRVLATPSDQMWYPTFDEMLRAHVVTSQSFGDRFASSVDGSDATMDAMVEKLGAYPGLSAIKELEPEVWVQITRDFVTAIRAGKSEAEASGAASRGTAHFMKKYCPAASDEALLAVRDQNIRLLSKYKDKNSRACISAFTDGKVDFLRAFPDWDATASLRVLDMVMRSSGATKITIAVDTQAASEDLKTVFKPIADKYQRDFLILVDESQWLDNSEKVSDMLLMMYQQIALLPDRRGANLMRYLLTTKE